MNTTLAPQNLTGFTDVAWAWMVAFLPHLLIAVAILAVGAVLARWVSSLGRRIAAGSGRVDPTIVPVLGAALRYAAMILVIITALGQVGVQTASLLAMLGAAGLAIGLALQGTLTNIAAGIMLLWLRPFRIGDYVEVNGMNGTVKEIGLFACELETSEGVFLFAPNSAIWNNALRNHSRNADRLITLAVQLPDSVDIGAARGKLREIAAGDERILKQPPPDTSVDRPGDSRVVLHLRAWALHENVGAVRRTLADAARTQFQGAPVEAAA